MPKILKTLPKINGSKETYKLRRLSWQNHTRNNRGKFKIITARIGRRVESLTWEIEEYDDWYYVSRVAGDSRYDEGRFKDLLAAMVFVQTEYEDEASQWVRLVEG